MHYPQHTQIHGLWLRLWLRAVDRQSALGLRFFSEALPNRRPHLERRSAELLEDAYGCAGQLLALWLQECQGKPIHFECVVMPLFPRFLRLLVQTPTTAES
jgi:hypothetical protein